MFRLDPAGFRGNDNLQTSYIQFFLNILGLHSPDQIFGIDLAKINDGDVLDLIIDVQNAA